MVLGLQCCFVLEMLPWDWPPLPGAGKQKITPPWRCSFFWGAVGSQGQSCPHGGGFLAHLETVAVSPPFCEFLELEMWSTAVSEVQLSGGAAEQRGWEVVVMHSLGMLQHFVLTAGRGSFVAMAQSFWSSWWKLHGLVSVGWAFYCAWSVSFLQTLSSLRCHCTSCFKVVTLSLLLAGLAGGLLSPCLAGGDCLVSGVV